MRLGISLELEPTPESFREFGRWSRSFLNCLRPQEPTREICLDGIGFLGYDIALTDELYAAFEAGWLMGAERGR